MNLIVIGCQEIYRFHQIPTVKQYAISTMCLMKKRRQYGERCEFQCIFTELFLFNLFAFPKGNYVFLLRLLWLLAIVFFVFLVGRNFVIDNTFGQLTQSYNCSEINGESILVDRSEIEFTYHYYISKNNIIGMITYNVFWQYKMQRSTI